MKNALIVSSRTRDISWKFYYLFKLFQYVNEISDKRFILLFSLDVVINL